jgi:hypothetical protein
MKKLLYLLAVLVLLAAVLLFAQGGHYVVLNWTASVTPSVTYNVYRSTITGGPYSQINLSAVSCCTFTDSSVNSGTTYYYVVRAFDGTSESVNSNEAKAVVPQGPQAPTNLTVTVH